MAVAVNNSCLALDVIPKLQKELDQLAGGFRRFPVHKVCVYVTILPFDSELWRQLQTPLHYDLCFERCLAKQEALDWQADPDDDFDELEVLHHLRQQAAAVPILSSVISSNGLTTLCGSALSLSTHARTQGRLLSSFHRHSFRQSCLQLQHPKPIPNIRREEVTGISRNNAAAAFLSQVRVQPLIRFTPSFLRLRSHDPLVWGSSQADDHFRFWQVQVDVIDLFSRRTLPTSRPGKRRRSAINPFLQVSHSLVVEDTSRRDPLQKYNGVRHRPDRKIWVAEMKPPKHQTKQDFGNFKSEAEAARAVDAAFHHYGRPDLLNFPDTSLPFLSTRPTAAPGLDDKAKVKFVREEAKLLLAGIAATSQLHSTPTNSVQFLELSATPRRCPSDEMRSLSEMSSLLSCSGPNEVIDIVSHPQPSMLLDSICDISTTGVQTNLETLISMQNAQQGYDWAEDSSLQAASPNVANPSAYRNESMWLDSLLRSPPALTYSRSPSPSHLREKIAYNLLEHQSI